MKRGYKRNIPNDYNLAFGKIIIPFAKLELILAFIITFFATVRLFKDLDVISLVFVSSVALVSSILIAPIAMVMSSLFDISEKFSRNLSPRIHLVPVKKNREIFERQVTSCPLIRCQVGSMYHMEAKAKLTIIDNVVNGVAFLMVNVLK